jgi:hypothetical protein
VRGVRVSIRRITWTFIVPFGYGSWRFGHFTPSSCMTLMVSLVLANKHQQSVRWARKTDRLSQTSERREASVERSLKCVCIWVEGFIISRSPLSLRCGLATGLQVAQREGPRPSTILSIWFAALRLWRSRRQNGRLETRHEMIGLQFQRNSVGRV